MTLRPSFTPSPEVVSPQVVPPEVASNNGEARSASDLEPEAAFDGRIDIQARADFAESRRAGDEEMKTTLREAMLGPSLVAVALGGVIFGAAQSRANEQNAAFGPSPRAQLQTENAPETTEKNEEKPAEKPQIRATAGASHPTYEAGRPTEFYLSVENVSKEAAVLNYTSGQRFDFEAYQLDRDGKPALKPFWKWSEGRMFTMALSSKTLAPGERENFKAQMDKAPRGKFQIRARSTANGGIEAAPFEVLVQ